MKRTAYIIRGLPGSGKSTVADQLAKAALAQGLSVAIHTTDDYFEAEGKYEWTLEKAQRYHRANYQAFKRSLRRRTDVVICPNTHVTVEQYQKYEQSAKQEGYRVFRLIMDSFNEYICRDRTKHKVPTQTIRRMAAAFEIQGYRKGGRP